MPNGHKLALQTLARFSLYTLGMLAGLASLPHLLEPGDFILFYENGPVEWLQFGLMGQAAVTFALGAWREPPMRCLFAEFAVVSAIATIREMDGIFDRIPVIRWEMPAAALLVFAIWYGWRHRATLGPQADYFVRTAPFGVLWAGFIVIALIAQLVGNGHFLELVMGDDYHRDYKRVIEEITELFGYLIFLLGAVETVLFDDKTHRNSIHLGNGNQ
ncbi:MAG: hypothetical protein ABFD91_18655 [Anaerohalosphaeraceae bacterium]